MESGGGGTWSVTTHESRCDFSIAPILLLHDHAESVAESRWSWYLERVTRGFRSRRCSWPCFEGEVGTWRVTRGFRSRRCHGHASGGSWYLARHEGISIAAMLMAMLRGGSWYLARHEGISIAAMLMVISRRGGRQLDAGSPRPMAEGVGVRLDGFLAPMEGRKSRRH